MKKITPFILLIVLAAGCKKEKSVDTGDFSPIFIGNNCRISQVLTVDSLTGIGFAAHNAFFNASFNPVGTEIYDSLSNSLYFASAFVTSGDTTYGSLGEYFIKDAGGRIKIYKGLDDPADSFSDTVEIKFTYDVAGNLTKKDYYYFGISVPLFRSTYTYTNGNLTRSVLESVYPTNEVVVDATAEYYTTQPAKGFLYVFPDDFLTCTYNLSFNYGNRPANTLKKLTTKIYDAGTLTDSLVTNYKNYKLSRDNYVLELFAEGDFQDGLGIIDGRTKFSYGCK
ncbi:MAG: hypothetical protein QM725_10995 [Lacibacter sp.]